VSNPSERGTRGRAPKVPREVWSGRGLCPSRENFCISYIKMVSFYAFLEIFIDSVTALTTCLNIYIFFKKGTLIKRAGVQTPWTPPQIHAILLQYCNNHYICSQVFCSSSLPLITRPKHKYFEMVILLISYSFYIFMIKKLTL